MPRPRSQWECEVGCPGTHSWNEDLESFRLGRHGAMQKESNAQQKDASWLVASYHSRRGQISMAAGGTSLPEGPHMDTNGHLGPRRILALTAKTAGRTANTFSLPWQ